MVSESAAVLEEALQDLSKTLEIPVSTLPALSRGGRPVWIRRPFFLYASPNDFLESNIAGVGEGTGGVTEPAKDRFMIYNDGSREWLREVATHELVHIMQFHVLISGFWKSGRILRSIVYPLWMMEGMASVLTHHIEETWGELAVRDAATSGGLLSLTRLEHFGHLKPHQILLAYKQGGAALEFMAEQYGRRKVGEFLKAFESHMETSGALGAVLGSDAGQFDRRYREHLQTRYRRMVRTHALREPDSYGGALTRDKDSIPHWNTCPVFSPDGRRMYFLTTRGGHPPEIHEMDLGTGRARQLPRAAPTRIENIPLGRFAYLSRVLAISPDGGRLVFAGTKNHRDSLYVYHLASGRLERLKTPGFAAIANPSFSPDGRRLVFAGMQSSLNDLYLLDLASERVERLTNDPEDDQMPVFTPDGRGIVYSSEVSDPRRPGRYGRRLHRLALGGPGPAVPERLEELPGSARDPVFSPDGTRLLFVHEDEGFSEIHELEVATGRVSRLTRSVGGAFTPAYAPDGEIAFAALRGGNVRIHKGPRADFLDETVAPGVVLPPPPPSVAGPNLGGERPYRFSAGTDLFLPAFFYSSEGGFFWTSFWQGSDMLGDHSATALVSYGSGNSSYDYAVNYAFRKYRPQLVLGVAGRGQRNLYEPGRRLSFNESLHFQQAVVEYPFDRFHRTEFGVVSLSDYNRFHDVELRHDRQTRALSAGFVRDTVKGRYLVANEGDRFRFSYAQSVSELGGNQNYDVANAEAQAFLPTGSQSAVAGRVLALRSTGRDRPGFIMGGVGGVRGYSRSTGENFGSRLAVGNLEWRFPVLPNLNAYMWWFVPDFYFKAVFGTIFTDAGYAWDPGPGPGRARIRDLRHSVGIGLRIFTFILQEFPVTVAMDYAHQTTANKGIFYVYLGQIF